MEKTLAILTGLADSAVFSDAEQVLQLVEPTLTRLAGVA
jgi:hypothetical protein